MYSKQEIIESIDRGTLNLIRKYEILISKIQTAQSYLNISENGWTKGLYELEDIGKRYQTLFLLKQEQNDIRNQITRRFTTIQYKIIEGLYPITDWETIHRENKEWTEQYKQQLTK